MPVFDTPGPISVTLDFPVGHVRIGASGRSDTVVEIRPSNGNDSSDVQAAAQTRVEYSNGVLTVAGPKRTFDFSRKSRSVEVSIDLPSGSGLSAHLQLGDVRATGRLGECRVKTTGEVRLERTGPLHAHTGFGQVTVDAVAGDAEVSTASGNVRLGEVAGAAVVRNSNGDTTLDAVTGDVRVRNANGAVDIGRAGAGVDAKTSNGRIRVGEVVCGSVVLGTAVGDLDVGVAEGTAAWFDANTGYGQVRNLLETVARPGPTDRTVEVRAHTSCGDVTIRRS